MQVLLLVLGLAAMKWRPSSRPSALLRATIGAAIVSLPLGMLVLGTLHPSTIASAALSLLAFTLLSVAAAIWRRGRPSSVVMTLSGALVLLICADLATGCRMLQSGWMSYSATDGSRFYGIGNEYMGAVIGAIIVLFSCFKAQRIVSAAGPSGDLATVPTEQGPASSAYFLLFTVMTLLMAAPFAGAKAGAIPSAAAPIAVMMMMDRRGRIRPVDMVVAVAAIVFVLAATAMLDMHGSQSHLIRSVTGQGGDGILMVIRRKLGMELRLFRHSPWTFTLLIGASALALIHRQTAKFRYREVITTRTIFTGLWWGASAALLCNDAGVLAAAMIMLYGCAWAFTGLKTTTEGELN